MFVHRGMFDAAASEGEVVGVMAHELSHVLLRHGTANASKAQNPWLQLGQLAGAIGGAVVGGGGRSGHRAGQPVRAGHAAAPIQPRFREAGRPARRADHGARRLRPARARAACSRRLRAESKSSGGGGPQWMSSHPNPGNRTQYITQEAEALTIASAADDQRVRDRSRRRSRRCRRRSRWPNSAKREDRAGGDAPSVGRHARPAGAPPVRAVPRASTAAGCSRPTCPSNWTALPSNSAIKVVPQNGYGPVERADGLQPRRRVRRGAGGVARSAGSHQRLAEGGRAEQPAARLAGDTAALRMSQRSAIAHAARQSVAARRAGADWASTRRSWPTARCSTT